MSTTIGDKAIAFAKKMFDLRVAESSLVLMMRSRKLWKDVIKMKNPILRKSTTAVHSDSQHKYLLFKGIDDSEEMIIFVLQVCLHDDNKTQIISCVYYPATGDHVVYDPDKLEIFNFETLFLEGIYGYKHVNLI